MLDKGHCMMPFENNDEFEFFYDFARQYKNIATAGNMITAAPAEEEKE